jgi:hypothetical protein
MPAKKETVNLKQIKKRKADIFFLSLPMLGVGLILVAVALTANSTSTPKNPAAVNQVPTNIPASLNPVTTRNPVAVLPTNTPALTPTFDSLTPTPPTTIQPDNRAALPPTAAVTTALPVLVTPTPARTIRPAATDAPGIRMSKTENGLKFDILISPGHIGDNTYSLTLSENGNQAVTDASSVSLAVTSLEMDMGVARLDLQPVGPDQPGRYSGQDDKLQMLSMYGKYRVEVLVQRPGKSDVTTFFEVSVTGT